MTAAQKIVIEPARPGIAIRGLRKQFGTVKALDGVDLDVRPGQVVALLGRNGAGKRTLLPVLGTTVLPDEGDAHVAGHHVASAAREVRRHTGLVLGEERSWYWRLSGRANLEFFGVLLGLRRDAARARADELLHLMQLAPVADQRFDGYSSGMRARLSIARALLGRPRVLLLDEPTRTLDSAVSADVRQVVLEVVHTEAPAVLWVTHDLVEARTVAGRVALLDAGRVVLDRETPDSADVLEALFLRVTAT